MDVFNKKLNDENLKKNKNIYIVFWCAVTFENAFSDAVWYMFSEITERGRVDCEIEGPYGSILSRGIWNNGRSMEVDSNVQTLSGKLLALRFFGLPNGLADNPVQFMIVYAINRKRDELCNWNNFFPLSLCSYICFLYFI